MSRTRTMTLANDYVDPLYTRTYTGTRGDCDGGPSGNSITEYPTAEILQKYHFREMTDVEVPNYHKLSRQGFIFQNPMSSYEVIEERTPCTYYSSRQTEKYGCTPKRWYPYITYDEGGTINFPAKLAEDNIGEFMSSSLDDADIATCNERAVSQAWSNVSQSEILSYVAMIEAGKSFKGIKDLLKMALKQIRAGRMKVHRFRKLGSGLTRDEVVDFYLGVRYNLRPLYYDIMGLSKALLPNQGAYRQTYRGQSSMLKEEEDHPTFAFKSSNLPYQRVDIDYHRFVKREIVSKAGVLVNWDGNSLNAKLGGHSFASSAWDLVRFSFIVDWFANVGDSLLSWMPIVGGQALTSWVTSTVTTTQNSYVGQALVDINSPPEDTYRWGRMMYLLNGQSQRVTVETERTPAPERTVIPNVSVNLDALKSLDLGLIVNSLLHEKNSVRKYRI